MGFRPSEAQKARFAAQYLCSNGTNGVTPHPIGNPYALSHAYDSGGAGLFSTVDDYMKIITVIANGGTTEDGYSLLRPETIRMLTENRLIPDAINDFVDTRLYGYGWGLCGRVHMNGTVSLSKSPIGEFGWDGAAGAFTMIDIENGVALYFGTSVFSARYVYNVIHPTIRNLVYEALETE
jgi:CubicO group peptidase (beta-lactamase class C family)